MPEKTKVSQVKWSSEEYLNHVMERNAKIKKPSKKALESKEQVLLINNFRLLYPADSIYLIHVPNGGSRKDAIEGARLKQQGVRAGVSDLFLSLPAYINGTLYHGFWMEFKATPPNDAKVSDKQKEWLDAVSASGYYARVGLGLNSGLDMLIEYMSGVSELRKLNKIKG